MGIVIITTVDAYADQLNIPNNMFVDSTDQGMLVRTAADDKTDVTFVFDSNFINMTVTKIWYKGEHSLSFDITPIKQGMTNVTVLYDNITLSQPITISSSIEQEVDAVKNLFVPRHILQQGTYKGVFVRDAALDTVQVKLSSDSDILRIPDYITIPQGRNHGTFDITTHGIGDANIIAKVGQDFWKASSTIHNTISSDYNIQLYLPEETSAQEITAAIYLVDDFNNPVYAESDIRVSLVGTNIDAPDYITIPKDDAHTFFTVIVHGQGTLTAYTDQSISDTVPITYNGDSSKIEIGISSDTVSANSFGYVFGWITDENDNIMRTPVPISGTIHVSGDRIVSLGDGPSTQDSLDDDARITINDGIFYHKFFTHGPGTSTITVSVPGYGTAYVDVSVKYTAAQLFKTNDPVKQVEYERPTSLKSMIFPPSTDSTAFLLVSMFSTVQERDLVEYCKELALKLNVENDIVDIIYKLDLLLNDTREDTLDDTLNNPDGTLDALDILNTYDDCNEILDESEFPAFGIELVPYTITSQNLEHDTMKIFLHDGVHTQTMLIPISGSIIGEHEIHVSAPNLPTTTSTVKITESKEYHLHLTPLPHLTGEYYPMFLISIQDSDGNTINPQDTFGSIDIRLISDEVQFEQDRIKLNNPITIIYGKSDIKFPSMSAIAINNDIVKTVKSEPISDLAVLLESPDKVRAGEQFPVYAYLMADDKPISDISHMIDTDCTGNGSMYQCYQDSAFYVFSTPYGLTNSTVDIFYNTFDDNELQVDFGSSVLYVDMKYTITTRIDEDISIDVTSDIPFNVQGNNIVLEPIRAGTYDVVIDFTKEGYIAKKKSEQYQILDDTLVTIRTANTDDEEILTTVNISYDDVTGNVETPDQLYVRRGPIQVSFPQDLQIGDTRYVYNMSEISDGTIQTESRFDINILQPTSIKAVYKPMITIIVDGGIGGGTFDRGEQTILYAPSRDVVLFLIRDVFDRWSGLPVEYGLYQEPVTVTATESFTAVPMYQTDYTGLIVVIVIGVLVSFMISQRSRISYMVKTDKSSSSES